MKTRELTFPVHVIAVGGGAATGKGDVTRALKLALGWELRSGGNTVRKMQSDAGMTQLSVDEFARQTPGLDAQIEEGNRRFVVNGPDPGRILESRLAIVAAKNVTFARTVLLTCDAEERMRRAIDRAQKANPPVILSSQQAWNDTVGRDERDVERYVSMGLPSFDEPEDYNIHIDTTGRKVDDVAADIIEACLLGVEVRVRRVLSRVLGIELGDFGPNVRLYDHLGVSLKAKSEMRYIRVGLCGAFGDHGITRIPERDSIGWITAQDIVYYIKDRLASRMAVEAG